MKKFLPFLLLAVWANLFGQSGFLDSNFATNGSLIMSNAIGGTTEVVRSVKILPDGRYIAGGYSGPYYACKHFLTVTDTAGDYDPNFNAGVWKVFQTGTNLVNQIVNIVPTSDGKFIILGKVGASSGDIDARAVVFRLNADGSADGTYPTLTFGTSSVPEMAKDIIYNAADGAIYVLTSYGSGSPLTFYTSRVRKILTDGTVEGTYGTSGAFSHATLEGHKIAYMRNGSIVIAGAVSTTYYDFGVVKLLPDGTADTKYGPTGLKTIPVTAVQNDVANSIVVDQNENILLAGYVVNPGPPVNIDIACVYLEGSSGNLLNTFSSDGIATFDIQSILSESIATNDYIETISFGQSNKIILGGASATSVNRGLVMQLNSDGTLDATFANSGVYVLSNPQSYFMTSAFSIQQGKLLMGGHANSGAGDLLVSKFNVTPPIQFNVVGKNFVSIESQNTYTISPQPSGYTYSWSYDSDSVYVFGKSDKPSFTIYFPDGAPSADLTCNVFNASGDNVGTVVFPISVKQYFSLADELKAIDCQFNQTRCDESYINSVSVIGGYRLSSATQCSRSGYSDFTAVEFYDTLTIGDRFSLQVECPPGKRQYAAAWIDLNNDGTIQEDNEFSGVGESDGSDSLITIFNISIPPQSLEGPVRLRIRCRASGPFAASEACSANSEVGETEDYLVLLMKGDNTIAPNFITPNNDGKNDFFVIRGIDQDAESNELKVFDRLGNLVFEMKNYDNSWQGKDKDNEPVTSGTYYYLFTQSYEDQTSNSEDVTKGFLEIRY